MKLNIKAYAKESMKRAWRIRYESAMRFHCRPSEIHFGLCLKMAWAEIKSNLFDNKFRVVDLRSGRLFKETTKSNRFLAFKEDSDFFVDFDDSNWGVFGAETGFCYFLGDLYEAEEKAVNLGLIKRNRG